MPPKKIHENTLRGQLGISLIETRVLKMGYVWYPTGAIEAGIDGLIEIRDPVTGVVFNTIVQVQSKATVNPFLKETPTSFEYVCGERDIEYWLGGNTPVVLIVSRPSTDEAYWIHVQEYFADLTVRKSRRVVFDKRRNTFDETCAEALKCLAVPRGLGLYSPPVPKSERLYSNLLSVSFYAPTLYLAQTHHRFGSALRSGLHGAGLHDATEWVLREGSILSFYDLTQPPWPQLCDRGTVKEFDADDWALSDDPDRQRTFVWLLNQAMRQFVAADLQYSRSHDAYYFDATPDLGNRVFSYQSLAQQTSRVVFRGYPSKKDPSQVSYYRHSAFQGHFLQFDGEWLLEIVPTYHFTTDGYRDYGWYEDLLKGIKRLEHNQAVLGQTIMWARYLTQPPTLFTQRYPFLGFGDLLSFDIDAGISDQAWLQDDSEQEDQEEPTAFADEDFDDAD